MRATLAALALALALAMATSAVSGTEFPYCRNFGASCSHTPYYEGCEYSEFCTEEYNPFCGDNGKTYGTECELKKERCEKQKDIKFVRRGACGFFEDCTDSPNDHCQAYKDKGHCDDEDMHESMSILCRKTCGFCTSGDGPKPAGWDPQKDCSKRRSIPNLKQLLMQLSGSARHKRLQNVPIAQEYRIGFTVAIYDPIVCYGGRCQPRRSAQAPLCTGVLVGKDLVLTAASCLVLKSKKKNKLIRRAARDLGVAFSASTKLDFVDQRKWYAPMATLADFYVHPKYLEDEGDSSLHDLALIKLTREVMLNSQDVMTICLPDADPKLKFIEYLIDGWSKKDKVLNRVALYKDMEWKPKACNEMDAFASRSIDQAENLLCLDKDAKSDKIDFKCEAQDIGAPLFGYKYDYQDEEPTFHLVGLVASTDKCDVFVNMDTPKNLGFVMAAFDCVKAGKKAKDCDIII